MTLESNAAPAAADEASEVAVKRARKVIPQPPHLQQVLSQVGESLRTHRVAMRLTQDLASVKAEISRQTASRIEQGDPAVSIGQVLRYADILGATHLFAIPVPDSVSPDQRRVRLSGEERTTVVKTVPNGIPSMRVNDPYKMRPPEVVISERVERPLAVRL